MRRNTPAQVLPLAHHLLVCLGPQDRTTRKLDLLRQQNMEMAAQEVQARVAGEPDIDVLTAATPVHRQYVMQDITNSSRAHATHTAVLPIHGWPRQADTPCSNGQSAGRDHLLLDTKDASVPGQPAGVSPGAFRRRMTNRDRRAYLTSHVTISLVFLVLFPAIAQGG